MKQTCFWLLPGKFAVYILEIFRQLLSCFQNWPIVFSKLAEIFKLFKGIIDASENNLKYFKIDIFSAI